MLPLLIGTLAAFFAALVTLLFYVSPEAGRASLDIALTAMFVGAIFTFAVYTVKGG